MIELPPVVRAKAEEHGAQAWVEGLDGTVAALCEAWSLTLGATFPDATEAYVAAATLDDGTPCVLKVMVPRDGEAASREICVLREADGDGCARLLRADEEAGAFVVERLGASLSSFDAPIAQRLEILCSAAERVWRPAGGCDLPSGAQRVAEIAAFIVEAYDRLGAPCERRTVDHALACAASREAGHDDARAVLVHGDVHQWNALASPEGFKLVDPDGVRAEPECDLGVLMREDPLELLEAGPHERSTWLAARCGLDERAIWEWGVVERVSTGLLGTLVGMQPHARDMLHVADVLAAQPW